MALFAPSVLQHLGEGGWPCVLALASPGGSLPCLSELNDSPQVRKYKSMILEDLESALAEHAPAPQEVNSELPPLTIDGIPVSVDKMTQVSSQRWQNQRERDIGHLAVTSCSFAVEFMSTSPGDAFDVFFPVGL